MGSQFKTHFLDWTYYILSSHDKHLLGQVCAKIRSFRKHDPYKGKGIRFVGERVRRKECLFKSDCY